MPSPVLRIFFFLLLTFLNNDLFVTVHLQGPFSEAYVGSIVYWLDSVVS